MKLPQIFTKTPKHKRFSYEPRFYDAHEEERKERENRIRKEVESHAREQSANEPNEEDTYAYRQRIAGSFRQAKKSASIQSDPSTAMMRLIILLILTVGLIAYLQWGKVAIYGVAFVFLPFYIFLKFRRAGKSRE